MYAGSHYAGLYRSNDAGEHWYNYHTDRGLPITSVGGVAVSHTNKVFVCTGNGDHGYASFGLNAQYNSLGPGAMNNANPIHTQGVYAISNNTTQWYSINGSTTLLDGNTVTDLRTVFEKGGTMRNIILHPTNENILLIATSEGVFRTSIGGTTWEQVLVGPTVGGLLMHDSEWRGLEFHPTNPNIIYASGQEVYKSIDGGATWTSMNITSILTGARRINIAVTPANTARVYAYAVLSNNTSSICWYDGVAWHFGGSIGNKEPAWLGIAVSPFSDSTVFVGAIMVHGNDHFGTGNAFFSKRSQRYDHFHDDVHSLVFPPNSDSLLFAGTHGGVSKKLTSNTGLEGWTQLYKGLGVATIWVFDDWEGNDSLLITANQDVGINHTLDYGNSWISSYSNGDGYGARIDDQTGKAYLKYNDYEGVFNTSTTNLNRILPMPGSPFNYTVLYPRDDMYTPSSNTMIQNAFSMQNHPKTDEGYLGFTELFIGKENSFLDGVFDTIITTTTTITVVDSVVKIRGPRLDINGVWYPPAIISPYGKTCTELGGTIVGIDTFYPSSSFILMRVDTFCDLDTIFESTTYRNYSSNISLDSLRHYLWQNKSDLKLHQPSQWNRRIMEIAFSEDEQTNYTYLATLGENSATGRQSDFYFNDADSMGCDTCFMVKTGALPVDPDVGLLVTDPNPVTGIAVDPLNGNRVWASFSGFSKNIKVHYSDDAGDTWTNYDDSHGSLAALNVPVNHIVYQRGTKDRLYIATDVGVYVREDAANGGRWLRYGAEFPNVRTVELKINYCTGKLRVATFGRGTWEIDLLPVEEAVVYRSFRTIDSDQTWTKDKHMSRDIRVKSGMTLKLEDMTLNMPKNGLIVVERGGQLIVENSTITNLCEQTWQGIEIEGTPSAPQTPFNNTDQGRIILRGSIVEYAKNAMLNCTNLDFSQTTGGIIIARETTFRNNWHTAGFMEYYSGKSDASSFRHCTFTVDDNYRPFDLDTIPNFLGHISMWNVVGVSIRACTFKDERTDKVGDPATGGSYGIYAFGATPKLTSYPMAGAYPPTGYIRNRFEGLERAIEIGGTPYAQTTMIDQCDFIDNEQAIKIQAQNLVQVTRNKFQIGGFDSQGNTSNTVIEEYGLGIVGAWAFSVEQNTFEGTSTDVMVGSWIEDTGDGSNRLRNNSYDSIYVANIAHGDNDGSLPDDGFQYLCNQNQQNLVDFIVTPNPYTNNAITEIAPSQGSASQASRNTLSSSASFQFYNAGIQSSINYWYAPQPLEIPDISKLSGVQDLQGAFAEGNCLKYYTYPNYGPLVSLSVGSPLGLPELKTNYNSLALNEENKENYNKAYFWNNQVLSHYMNDSINWEADSIETWILKKTGLYARYELVEHYWQQKRYQDAINYLENIRDEFSIEGRDLENYNHCKSLKLLLWNAYKKGRTEATLTKLEVDELRAIAVDKVGFASVQAANIVAFFYSNAPDFYPALSSLGEFRYAQPKEKEEKEIVLSPTIWRYPNPTVDWIDVVYELPDRIKEGILEINVVSGQMIQRININQNNGVVTLNTSTWSPGIYFATLSIEGMQSNTYKIVIRK